MRPSSVVFYISIINACGCSGAASQAQYGPSHAQGLHGRVKSYAETLQKLNEADRSKEKVSAVDAFASAAAADPDGNSQLSQRAAFAFAGCKIALRILSCCLDIV